MSAGEGVESTAVTAAAAVEGEPDSTNGAPGPSEEDLAQRTLYVVNLPSSSDELLIESLFEPDEIASTQVSLPYLTPSQHLCWRLTCHTQRINI